MRIDIITCLPGLLASPFGHSIVKRAIGKGVVTIQLHDLRDYATDKHRSVDDKPYGGGAGMVLLLEPIVRCIEALQQVVDYDEIIYMAPDGVLLDQPMANTLSLAGNLLILCGHYKGVDERVRTHFITKEVSIGNYVLSGGELAAAVLVDSLVRLLPGVLSDETSALTDSFQDNLVAPAVYSKPRVFRGHEVPSILYGGHAAAIEEYQVQEALVRTRARRPSLIHDKR